MQRKITMLEIFAIVFLLLAYGQYHLYQVEEELQTVNDNSIKAIQQLQKDIKEMKSELDSIKEQIVVYSPTDGRRIWDVVIGLGTYGSRAGLLELMWEDSGEVVGCLTAEGVIRETGI